jgi:serine phosphatase RsbU (regulator of sigma subunit)/pSer/pThr/pTyr-binding forkhead associated (FHA) protein
VPLVGSRTTVGRRGEKDLCLAGADVSRDHAEIVADAPGVYKVRDCGSRFGTFVNGEQVQEHALRHGDEIRFGRSGSATAVFLLESSSPADRTSTSIVSGLRQVTMLLDGLRALGSGRVLDEVVALVIDSAIALAGAERGFVMLAQPSGGALEFMLGRSHHGKTLPATSLTSRKIPEEVFNRGEARVVPNLPDSDVDNAHLNTQQLGIRHVVCVPLRLTPFSGGQQDAPREPRKIGVLYLDSQKAGQLLSPETLQTIETLATEASVAIEHARLYREAIEKAQIDRELKIAAEIQRMLVPARQRSTPSIEAAGTTIPCRAIGGDFFDLYDLPDNGFGFAVADISGKGVPAALLAAALQGAFAAHATSGPSPAEAIIVGNAVLYGRFEGKFATMFYGVISPDGRFAYCNAGHNPPLLVRANGELCKLDVGGCVLGLFADNHYEEGRVSLEPGDLVVVFSDGLPEAIDPAGNEFGDARIETLVTRNAEIQASALLDGILQEVGRFAAGAPPRDDLTIVVLRYRGQEAPAALA